MHPHELRLIYAQCRQLQLFIQLFNYGFSYYIFALKVAAISLCIFMFSFGIHLIHSHTESWTYLLAGAEVAVTFPALFDKGFAIPRQTAQLKRLALAVGVGKCNGSDSKGLVSRLFRSLPNLGVKVGSFHQLERMSTLNFVMFVSVNVVRTLIALKK